MIKNIVSVAAAVLGAGVVLTGCNFDQPTAGCIVQDASFANWYAKYDLKSENLTPECQALVLGGETWGVFKFVDPDKADSTILTIRPAGLYSRAALDPCDSFTQAQLREGLSGQELRALNEALMAECGPPEASNTAQTAVGKLAEEPDAQNFCATSDWKAGTVRPRPAGSVRPEVTPTTSISYQFDGVRVYAAPEAPGTQLTAELTYTRENQGGALCTINYHVRAMWPLAACDPESDSPADNCGEGSGINPEFDVVCDETLLRCVPAKEIPSLK
jgi:hypothetical protein